MMDDKRISMNVKDNNISSTPIRLVYRWLTLTRSWIRCFLVLFSISLTIFFYNAVTAQLPAELSVSGRVSSEFEFTNDNLKIIDSRITQNMCTIVHIASVCAGNNSTESLSQMVKSILYYRSHPLHFHFLTDGVAKEALETLFEDLNLPQVNVSFYDDKKWIPKVAWIPNKHYSGVYGLLKLILPDALLNIDKVIVLDTDIIALTDLLNLWNNFDKFEDLQMLGIAENQSDLYTKIWDTGIRPWPAIGNGYNTGVMLMDLKRIRERNIFGLWMAICKKLLKEYHQVRTADQDIINATIKENELIVFTLECTWNVQLGDRTTSDECYGDGKKIQILHWNSRQKLRGNSKHVKNFQHVYRFFHEMDRSSLCHRLIECGSGTIGGLTC